MAEINKEDIFGLNLDAPLKELQGTLEDVLGTLDNLRQSGKKMESSFKETTDVTKATSKETKKLTDSLTELDKTEKKLDETVKKQTKTQKGSSEAFKDSTEALDKLAPAQSGVIKGFQGMITAAKAFIATPIGAVIAALSIVIGVVIKAFQKFEPVIDFFENLITKASAAVNSFLDNIKLVGNILGNVLTGQFSKAWEGTKQLAGAMGDAADEAQRLLDLTRDLEDAELRYRVESASAANQIKAWVTAAKNRNNTIEESEVLLKRASDLENEMTAKAVENANKRYEIERGLLVESKRSQLIAKGLQEQGIKSNAEYVKALIDSGVFSPEQLNPLISAYEKIEQEASAGLALQEKIANNQAMLDERREAARLKRMQQEELEQTQLENRATIEGRLAKYKEDEIAITPSVVKGKMDIHAADHAVTEAKKNQAEIQKVAIEQQQEESATLQSLSNSFGRLSATLRQGTIAQRLFANAQAIINTYLAVTQVLANPLIINPLAKAFAISSTIATGLAAIAKINGVRGFFKGTKSAPEGFAMVGERGAELMNVPGQGLMLSPNNSALTYLKKGTEIIPHEQSMAMLAKSGIDIGTGKDFRVLSHLQLVNNSVKEIGDRIVNAVSGSAGQLVQQGSQTYMIQKNLDGSRKMIRLKSLSA